MQLPLRLWKILKANFKRIVTGILLLGILFLAFWIRVQGRDAIPEGQFTETDAYLYYWQADIIAKQGYLPAKDMHRWLPDGRDNQQLLSLYSYVIAYTHKTLGWIFPKLTLYQIQLYAPVVCFTLGLGVLFLFLTRIYGFLFAVIVGVLLATLPGSIDRSSIGFGDRDAWCWLLGVLAIISYLWKEQLPLGKHRLIANVFSGFIVFLGGLSWEGFGFLLAIILTIEFWKFCTTDKEKHLKEYLLWVLLFVPGLFIISPAYRSGYGFSTHLTAIMLLPPLVIFAIRCTRYLLLKYVKVCRNHPRKIAWGLIFFATAAGVVYIFVQYNTFETTAFAFRESPIMKNVSELANPNLTYWIHRYGAVFVLGSIGLILASNRFGTYKGAFLGTAFFLFVGTVFFRDLVSRWVGTNTGDIIFFLSLGLMTAALAIASMRKSTAQNEYVILAMFIWFLLWGALARGGKRYDFFLGVPLAFGTASLLWLAPAFFAQNAMETIMQKTHWKEKLITTACACVVLTSILFLTPLGGNVTHLARTNFKVRSPIPGKGHIAKTLTWIKNTLPKSTVMAANWNYGTQFNVLANVKSITDSDHFLPHWIHLYYRHVHCAQNEKEALEFLKTHKATHLMLTEWGVTSRAHAYSKIGSDKNNDRLFGFYPLMRVETPIGTQYRMIPTHPERPFVFIDFDKTVSDTLTLTTQFKDGNTQKTTINNPTTIKLVDLENGGLALYFDEHTRLRYAYYIPSIGWNSLAVKLFLRGKHSQAFIPIYPISENEATKSKIWEIHYPSDIQASEKYLVTEPKKN